MEFLKLSKFKLQLRTLITEVREFREREQSSAEQFNLTVQKQKQNEEEFGRKLQELQAELASSNEMREKLERKVSHLENENALLENKQKELKATMNSLVSSKENFTNAYQDSTCEMKRSIEIRDRKVNVLIEKINSHLLLFDSIEKESFSVKQLVDNVLRIMSEKENVVAELKSKMDNASALEKVFVGKIHDMESKLRNVGDELLRKDGIISELEPQVEAGKISSSSQPQIEELQRTLSAKEVIIQNLLSEKKALHFEVGSLGFILQKIKDTATVMNEEDKRMFPSIVESQEGCAMGRTEENYRIEDAEQRSRGNSPCKASDRGTKEDTAFPHCQDHNSVSNHLQENDKFGSCLSDPACVEHQLASNALSISVHEANDLLTKQEIGSGSEKNGLYLLDLALNKQGQSSMAHHFTVPTKDDCMEVVYQLDSKSSTTQAEGSEPPAG